MMKNEARNTDDLARDARKAKDATVRDIKDAAHNLESRLKATAHDAGEKISQFYSANKDRVNDVRHKTEERIKERPLTAAAIAFAGGYIISRLLKR